VFGAPVHLEKLCPKPRAGEHRTAFCRRGASRRKRLSQSGVDSHTCQASLSAIAAKTVRPMPGCSMTGCAAGFAKAMYLWTCRKSASGPEQTGDPGARRRRHAAGWKRTARRHRSARRAAGAHDCPRRSSPRPPPRLRCCSSHGLRCSIFSLSIGENALGGVLDVAHGCATTERLSRNAEGSEYAGLILRLSPLELLRAQRWPLDSVLTGSADQLKGKIVVVGVELPQDRIEVTRGLHREVRYGTGCMPTR
jgi:hypothetical protein